MNLAKNLKGYSESHCKCSQLSILTIDDQYHFLADVSKTGGTEYNSPDHSGQDGSKKGSDSPGHESE